MDDNQTSILEFSSDISEAEAPDPLPVGDYVATITAAEGKISNNSGKKYVAVSFRIPVEEFPADYDPEQAPDGKTIIYRRVPGEDNAQARYQVRQFCEAVGSPMSKTIDIGEWVTLSAKVSVAHEEYEGTMREVITRVSAAA